MTTIGATPPSLYLVQDSLSESESERLHDLRDQSQTFETNPADEATDFSREAELSRRLAAYLQFRERRRKRPKAALSSSPQIKYNASVIPSSPFDKPGALINIYA